MACRLVVVILLLASLSVLAIQETVPAVRVVRFQVDYPNATLSTISKYSKWNSILHNSVLASLRFINKHWLICGGIDADKKASSCGKVQVTGEVVRPNHYRINTTFIAERDPIRNAKVDATSTVFAVVQIGLRGGIFQYTNALKTLGKPFQKLSFEEAFFCYPGSTLVDQDKCILCKAGTYQVERSRVCEPCERGKYQPRSGQTKCRACPIGMTTQVEGSVSLRNCIENCNSGEYFDKQSSKCKPCGFFAYQPESASAACIPCPEHKISYVNNATSIHYCVENCSPGFELDSNGSCVPCSRGFYKSVNETKCIPCNALKTTESTGSTDDSFCIITNCSPGLYLDKDFGQCIHCALGYYENESGSQSCKKCPAGFTTRQIGAKSVDECVSTNQCITGEHKCHWLSACFDLPDIGNRPRYGCKCKPGFVGNGFDCTDICLNLCYNGAKCLKTARGEPKCICRLGYVGLRCEHPRKSELRKQNFKIGYKLTNLSSHLY